MLRIRTIGSALALVLLLSSAAFGQGRLEITPMVGVSTAGSVDLDNTGPSSFSVGSGFTWGGTLGYFNHRHLQFEIEYARQNSSLKPKFPVGPGVPASIDLGIDQILGNFVFQTSAAGGRVAPFLLVGLGAAVFTPDDSELQVDLDSTTRFQWGIGGGVKLYVTDHIGFRVQGRYKPTNVGSQPEIWCGIWTCAVVDATQYLDSGEFLGGVIIRL